MIIHTHFILSRPHPTSHSHDILSLSLTHTLDMEEKGDVIEHTSAEERKAVVNRIIQAVDKKSKELNDRLIKIDRERRDLTMRISREFPAVHHIEGWFEMIVRTDREVAIEEFRLMFMKKRSKANKALRHQVNEVCDLLFEDAKKWTEHNKDLVQAQTVILELEKFLNAKLEKKEPLSPTEMYAKCEELGLNVD